MEFECELDRDDSISVAGSFDDDGLLYASVYVGGESGSVFLSRDSAVRLRDHLSAVLAKGGTA